MVLGAQVMNLNSKMILKEDGYALRRYTDRENILEAALSLLGTQNTHLLKDNKKYPGDT